MDKLNFMLDMYRYSLSGISQSGASWQKFLKTAGANFKYSFADQVMIYAQQRDAVACADAKLWNDRLHRQVKADAKGIALIGDGGGSLKLNYVYDVSETESPDGSILRLWQYDDEYDGALINALTNTYGRLEIGTTMEDAVISASKNAVRTERPNILNDLRRLIGERTQLDSQIESLARNSVAYMVLTRLGLNPDELYDREDFDGIVDFGKAQAVEFLGKTVSGIAEKELRLISAVIAAEAKKARVDNRTEAEYNKINNEEKERNENDERIGEVDNGRAGYRVSQGREISGAGRGAAEEGVQHREIRSDEEDIPQEPQGMVVRQHDSERDALRPSGGSEQGSDGENRRDSQEYGGSRRDERGAESRKPNEMGGADEQLPSFGGRNRSSEPDIQLSFLDFQNQQEQQIEQKEQREAEPVGFASLSVPEQIIDEMLCGGTNDPESVIRICVEFSKNKPIEDKAAFLKELYDIGGKGFVSNNAKVSSWWDRDGIRIAFGNSAKTEKNTAISWEDAARRIDELLDLGRFAPSDTLITMRDYEYGKAAEAFIYMARNLNRESYPETEELLKSIPDNNSEAFSDKVKTLVEYLQTDEGLNEAKRITERLCELCEENPDILRFPNLNKPQSVDQKLGELYIPRKIYTAETLSYNSPERFVSNDEIDLYLTTGLGADRKYGIYLIFESNPDKKARATYLKSAYGIGGSYDGVRNESHDSNGIEFSHGSLIGPYAKVALKWSDVEQHINSLITNGKYLSPKEIENIPQYETEQLAKTVHNAYYGAGENVIRPYPADSDYYDAVKMIKEQLKSADRAREIYNELNALYLDTPAEDKHFSDRENAVKDLEKYLAGEYNLFPKLHDSMAAPVTERDISETVNGKKYELGFGELGNGVTVWNKLEEINHDYKTVAHISEEGKVTYYEDMPHEVKAKIENQAEIERATDQSRRIYEKYCEITAAHPDSVVLYQVGHFFEIYGEKAISAAEMLEIQYTQKTIRGIGKTAMCGFPVFSLEKNIEKLRSKYDVTISATDANTGERRIYTMLSVEPANSVTGLDKFSYNPENETLVWSYFNPDGNDGNGQIVETTLYPSDIRTALEGDNLLDTLYQQGETTLYDIDGINGDNETIKSFYNKKADLTLQSAGGSIEGENLTLLREFLKEKYPAEETAQAEETAEPEQPALRFDTTEFERLIPHKMRWKQTHVVNGNEMYWVTQEIFSARDLRDFQQAVRDYDGDIKKFYLTPRDLSSYTYEVDLANKALAIITPDAIFEDDYINAVREAGLADYLNDEENTAEETAQAEETAEQEEAPQEVPSSDALGGFVYNGFHFEAVGDLDKSADLYYLARQTIYPNELMMSVYDNFNEAYNAKYPYTHEDFYDAAGNTSADVFRCLENGKFYLPGENMLFEYTGTFWPHQAEIKKRAVEIAKKYKNLSTQERLKVVAQTFGYTQAEFEITPCYGKYRGTSDVFVRFHGREKGDAGMFVINAPTVQIWAQGTRDGFADALVRKYNPEIVQATKEAALTALIRRQEKDNAVAAQKGLKPYTVLNVELQDTGDDIGIGEYYVTLAVDGKIRAHFTTGLNYDISDGKVSEDFTRENYYIAGGLKESDVDYVFNNVGYSSTSDMYTTVLNDDVRERAEKTLAARISNSAAEPNETAALKPTITCEWSESTYFEDGKTYSVKEFDDTMRQADKEYFDKKNEGIERYGSWEKMYEADDPSYKYFLGYDKVKFTVNLPDGSKYTDRQDIGDGDGGVIDFLRKDPQYESIIPILEQAIAEEAPTPERSDDFVIKEKTAAVYPAGKNNLPYDIEFRTISVETVAPQKRNYTITDNEPNYGGDKEKYRHNIEAITTLKQIESENRFATPEEQETLARYVGWGGLANAFDGEKDNWANEYKELSNLLTPEEYEQARASTLNAHYTSPTVIKAMYKALGNLGFQSGNILEPSCGIGNFMGLIPESMDGSKVYGVELDSVTGRIAKQLYPENEIQITGFENSNYPDSFFDAAIGNVPFGDYKVNDKKYNKLGFFIHDYFFAKALDKVRPGGIVAFITSKGTLDKQNSSARKYIAQRAELLGAIRLPNDAFAKNAGTRVTSDIIFLQKRDRIIETEPDWVHLGKLDNGIAINQYFVDNPHMILGEMTEENTQYGHDYTCKPFENANLAELLDTAIQNIHGQITEYEADDVTETDQSIPADPNVRNFSYALVDGKIYFREDSRMTRPEVSPTAENRIKGMIEIRDCVRQLIDEQLEGYDDETITKQQEKLNALYDNYTAKYGILSSRANSAVFSADSSYYLLASLEDLDEDGKLKNKAAMFSKRTISPNREVTHVDTASEALAVSLGEKARVDMEYMSGLTGKTEQEMFEELKGVIFLNPLHGYGNDKEDKYLTADEYLSGNVREKLDWAQRSAKLYPDDYNTNVEALKAAQPKDLTAAEIDVRLGATWVPIDYIDQFIYNLLDTPYWSRTRIKTRYAKITGEWRIENKSNDYGNAKSEIVYGTSRMNAYKIIEETLNMKDVRIYDYIEDNAGNKKAVLNKKETDVAQEKQAQIKEAFQNWIWKDPLRRENLCKIYNEKFNSVRPREYDGSHIVFVGSNPEIELRQHQKNAAARILYGGNTLLGHVVGAGKTWTMAASAMESRRLGLCSKPLFVVPNHLTEQWGAEFLQLYPAANILVATKKDFEPKNRKRFCARIATGDYDAVIIGQSQFEKIPLSIERQREQLEKQLDEIIEGINNLKYMSGERFSVKQLEKTRKNIQLKLDKLNDQSRKDDVVTFEELGVDRLYVDEAHYYKNLYLYTKMRNVAGISQQEAQKSSDLFMKTQYLNEITGGKGVVFATGTPISNSMTEMYTMQRYLQYNTLEKSELNHFDAWASTFGETTTAIELAPEGTGFRARTRFARFFNLPELMTMFKETADIQTADMLNLPVPQAEYHTVTLEPSEFQKDMVADLAKRAENVRSGNVDPSEDNMLNITNDGRKLALDQRIINPDLPDNPNGKSSACAENVFDIWQKTTPFKGTQLIFCDLSTPKKDGSFNVYDDIREKLIEKGIPEKEIAFIHDADTEAKKEALFSKVRNGSVRVLLGSTQKMGAGTNVQNLLYASHDLDCPWRPADLEQRSGRIIRQGNDNKTVHIYRYVTKNTFDSYMWQTVENKQKFISQIMTSKSPVRTAEDIDETALSYAEIKALATGNPEIKEKMELDTEVAKLKILKSAFLSQKYDLEDKVMLQYPQQIKALTQRISGMDKDLATVKLFPKVEGKFNAMTIDGKTYQKREEAGAALLERCKKMVTPDAVNIGSYRGFDISLKYDTYKKTYELTLKGALEHNIELGHDAVGNIRRIDNTIEGMPEKRETLAKKLTETEKYLETAKKESLAEFPREAELAEKTKRLAVLNARLSSDERLTAKSSLYQTICEKFSEVINGTKAFISSGDIMFERMGENTYSYTMYERQGENFKREPCYTFELLKDAEDVKVTEYFEDSKNISYSLVNSSVNNSTAGLNVDELLPMLEKSIANYTETNSDEECDEEYNERCEKYEDDEDYEMEV